jgi:hypothetical protein
LLLLDNPLLPAAEVLPLLLLQEELLLSMLILLLLLLLMVIEEVSFTDCGCRTDCSWSAVVLLLLLLLLLVQGVVVSGCGAAADDVRSRTVNRRFDVMYELDFFGNQFKPGGWYPCYK